MAIGEITVGIRGWHRSLARNYSLGVIIHSPWSLPVPPKTLKGTLFLALAQGQLDRERTRSYSTNEATGDSEK